MIDEPPPNTIARPYRGLSVHEVGFPLTATGITEALIGREVYRRTEYVALIDSGRAALVAVRKASFEPLFSPIIELRVLAIPEQTVYVNSPETDVGNATSICRVAMSNARPGARAYLVKGRYEHVNFVWDPQPLRIRVTEVVPPAPPKLYAMAKQVVAFDEDLPPIELVLDTVDIEAIARLHPRDCYLLPCRGSGVDLPGAVSFLDTRPPFVPGWLLIGCDRSVEFHRHFYDAEPERIDICPRRRTGESHGRTLSKCCLLERGIEWSDGASVVPWGANLDEVRAAIRRLCGIGAPPGRACQGSDHDDPPDRFDPLPPLVEHRRTSPVAGRSAQSSSLA
jgi:hypothetical protein